MLIERNLSIHPDVRTQARLTAALESATIREVVGEALTRLAGADASLLQRVVPADRKRVSIVAVADQETWSLLDSLREASSLSWNSIVAGALRGIGGGDA